MIKSIPARVFVRLKSGLTFYDPSLRLEYIETAPPSDIIDAVGVPTGNLYELV